MIIMHGVIFYTLRKLFYIRILACPLDIRRIPIRKIFWGENRNILISWTHSKWDQYEWLGLQGGKEAPVPRFRVFTFTDFYDRSTRTIVGTMLWTEYRPVIKIGPKDTLGSHEIRPIHSAPSLGQSIGTMQSNWNVVKTTETGEKVKKFPSRGMALLIIWSSLFFVNIQRGANSRAVNLMKLKQTDIATLILQSSKNSSKNYK